MSKFVTELGLDLVSYKYLTSTSLRTPLGSAEFGKFALDKLPKQLHMRPMIKKYLAQKNQLHYTLDDYVILAKKAHI
ncbi:MAG: hypothetical protein HXY43_25325 [Fischerella sp.]|uniref:hypothetical protein n=1 Tax=Fischerella sp. TaxID=1191 RepID=UPI0017B4A462|nr:hypothetical protein [Fischerella sp.]NWF62468.1 hypothetical protein [Fischerella sp.]